MKNKLYARTINPLFRWLNSSLYFLMIKSSFKSEFSRTLLILYESMRSLTYYGQYTNEKNVKNFNVNLRYWVFVQICTQNTCIVETFIECFVKKVASKLVHVTLFFISISLLKKVTDIKHFSLSYWLLALAIMFFYNGVFPFVADAR